MLGKPDMNYTRLKVIFLLLLLTFSAQVTAMERTIFDGLWRTEGYGLVFRITGSDRNTIYQVTSMSCLPYGEIDVEPFDASVKITTLNNLTYFYDMGFDNSKLALGSDIRANRIDSFPEVCTDGGTPTTDDPILNFEVFWHTFNEYYSLFDVYDVDWQAVYDEFRPQITPDMSNALLRIKLTEMLSDLNDVHVNLHSEGRWFNGNPPTFNYQWVSQIEQNILSSRYLDGNITQAVDGLVNYGLIGDSIGYLAITSFNIYLDERPIREMIQLMGQAADDAVAFFTENNVQGVIVDVRFNGGGSNIAANVVANRFADAHYRAITVTTREGDVYYDTTTYTVEPMGLEQFTGPVVVLIGPASISATENFALMMRELPHVTLIGETTWGGFSDQLLRVLPNGWTFSLSHQRFVAADGEIYEGRGVSPDIAVAFNESAIGAGVDTVLDAAVDFIDSEQQ